MQVSSQRSSQRLSRSTVIVTPAYSELHSKGFVILRGEVSRSDCRKLRDGATRECYEPILRDKLRLVAFNATLAPLATRLLDKVCGSHMVFVMLLLIPPFTHDCRCWADTGSLTAATAQRRAPVTSLRSSLCRAYPLARPLAKRHSMMTGVRMIIGCVRCQMDARMYLIADGAALSARCIFVESASGWRMMTVSHCLMHGTIGRRHVA